MSFKRADSSSYDARVYYNFASGLTFPLTFACFAKNALWNNTAGRLLSLGREETQPYPSVGIGFNNASNWPGCSAAWYDDSNSADAVQAGTNTQSTDLNGIWVACIAQFNTSFSDQYAYVWNGSSWYSANNTLSPTITTSYLKQFAASCLNFNWFSARDGTYIYRACLWSDYLTSGERDSFKDGTAPTSIGSNLEIWWEFDGNANDSSGNARTGTTGGTENTHWSWSSDNPVFTSATISLYDKTGADQANLSSVSWAWFDANPSAGATATDAGTAQITDSNGQMVLSIPNSTLTSGQTGWLLLYDSTGSKVGTYNVAVD